MKIEHVLFRSVFFKITDPCDGRSFLMCSHDPFFGTNKNRILKNGSCEQSFTSILYLSLQNCKTVRIVKASIYDVRYVYEVPAVSPVASQDNASGGGGGGRGT